MKPILCSISVATLILCALPRAEAGILGDMTQMVMSNTTAPGTVSSRDRAGVFGGSIQMRVPVQSVNLVAFDPPRFDAGCGGVDLYGGSFSFINSQQLVAVFRQVAANAVGLAFKAAVNTIAPNLGNLMSEFQAMMQNLNGLAKNSCHLAGLLVDKGERALSDAIDGEGATAGQRKGLFSDSIDSLTNYLKDGNKYLVEAGKSQAKSGNATYKSILNSGASAMLGLAGFSNFDASADDASNPNSLNNRILVSLLGYQVSGLPCTNVSADGTPDVQVQPGGANLSNVSCNGPATITLHDIVEGGGTGSPRADVPLKVYVCENPLGNGATAAGEDRQPCTNMRAANLDYPGIRGYINQALFGNVDPNLPPAAGSIVAGATSAQALSSQQRILLRQTGIPFQALMARARSLDMRTAIARKLSEQLVNCAGAAVGEALYKASNAIQRGGDNNLSDDVKRRIDQLRGDYLAFRSTCSEDRRTLEVIQQINESMRLASNHNR